MKKNGEKIFWGVFFILGAVFLLVSKMGYLQGISVLTLFLAVLFAACLIKSIIHVKFAGILFSLAFLAILFDEPLGIEAITPWPVLGAALLGSIGLNLLFKGKWNCKWNSGEFPRHSKDTVDVESEVIGEDANYMKYETTFGDSIKYVNSDDFKRLNLECTFGGMKVYFDNAIIQGGSAVVELKGGVCRNRALRSKVMAGGESHIGSLWRSSREEPSADHRNTDAGVKRQSQLRRC